MCTTWFEVVVCLKILIKYVTVIFNMMLHIAGFAQTYKLLNVSSFLLKLSKEKKNILTVSDQTHPYCRCAHLTRAENEIDCVDCWIHLYCS